MAKLKWVTHCPQCDSIWEKEERKQGSCDTCGYPEITEEDFTKPIRLMNDDADDPDDFEPFN